RSPVDRPACGVGSGRLRSPAGTGLPARPFQPHPVHERGAAVGFQPTSPAFKDGGATPSRYARDGGNLSPPLEWRQPPAGTRSFALLVDGPGAASGGFRPLGV